MRTTIALAIYVSLAVTAFAESAPEWTFIYNAGLVASQHHSYDEAFGFFQQSWKTASTDEERGAAAVNLGQTYRRLGRTNEARLWLERAVKAWSADPRMASKNVIASATLADVYRAAGDYAAAERLLRQVLQSSSPDEQIGGIIRNNLADLLREEGRSTEAIPLFNQSIDGGDRSDTPWQQRVGAMLGLADIERQNAHWQASIEQWNDALEICRRERDVATEAVILRGLAMTWLEAGTPARAEPLFRRALRMMQDDADTPPEQLASALSGIALLYRSENKLALAENEWSHALQIDRAALGENHPQVAWLMEMLADLYSARGEFDLARDYATRASEMMAGTFGQNSMPVATALTTRALVEQRAGNLPAAAGDYEAAIGIARAYPEHRPVQAVMIQRYAELLKTMHRNREAKALLAQGGISARSFR